MTTLPRPSTPLARSRLMEALRHHNLGPEIFEREVRSKDGAPAYARDPDTVRARAMVWLRMRTGVGGVSLSYPEIAAACQTGHSTVMRGVKLATELRARGEALAGA
jgi:hypothetical protein